MEVVCGNTMVFYKPGLDYRGVGLHSFMRVGGKKTWGLETASRLSGREIYIILHCRRYCDPLDTSCSVNPLDQRARTLPPLIDGCLCKPRPHEQLSLRFANQQVRF